MLTQVVMPQMGESVAEGTVTKWYKRVGDRVERDEPLFEISTDKVDAEIPSPAAGVLTKILVGENQTVEVNTVVAEIETEGSGAAAPGPEPAAAVAPAADTVSPPESPGSPAAARATEPASPPAPPPTPAPSRREVRSSPLVRRLAKEHNIDLALVPGTGLGGRVSKKDVLAYLAHSPGTSAPPPASAPLAAPSIPFSGPTQVVPMTPMRRQIAERMLLSRRTSAHVSTVFEVEMTRVSEVRAQQAAEFERRHALKLTYTPFFVRAAVEALKQFPILNSSVDGTNIVYKRAIHIGIAVALESGLIVPVIKGADEKNFLGIARAIHDLAERARTKRLGVEDVQDGTFTITNPGIFGSLFGTPIINQPQVAIMGVGAIEKRAVVRHDAIAIRPMVYLSLSFDHRVIDGAVADQFLARVKSVLENWEEAVL